MRGASSGARWSAPSGTADTPSSAATSGMDFSGLPLLLHRGGRGHAQRGDVGEPGQEVVVEAVGGPGAQGAGLPTWRQRPARGISERPDSQTSRPPVRPRSSIRRVVGGAQNGQSSVGRVMGPWREESAIGVGWRVERPG